MSNEIAVSEGFTPEQVDLIKKTIFKNSTDDEMRLFLYIAKRSGLDPFARQIYAVKRKDHRTGEWSMTVQTGIDGFRLTASRTGAYAGRDEGVFEYNSQKLLVKAKVTIYKLVQGMKCGFTATALWDEYYPGDGKMGFMWKKLPETMLEKCCEAKALRMAFPAELSGIYGSEEMQQADKNLIVADQPGKNDGDQSWTGQIKYGQYAGRRCSEIDPKELRSYVERLEAAQIKLKEKGKDLTRDQIEMIKFISEHLADLELSFDPKIGEEFGGKPEEIEAEFDE